ncbi:GFA family protein [Pollutimonas thiosulfatoxidans]|uniref:CENP-V/GFA domain-containing protein n=2 Tax=Pollutimonas thiosulfatoxidans TaxID=2028345 RepID=A0A410G8L1_9BURK|nr:hypothetical protein CKA81_01370 [Pollutimonas thiosulfatoxidans]
MIIEGGCYCGSVRYRAEGEALFKLQCHCRECQYISGGGPNIVMGMPENGFSYTLGNPRLFSRTDLPAPVTRHFCSDCGTHLLTTSPRVANAVLLKVGTLDDPAVFGRPSVAIFGIDKQPFHHVPEDIPLHERRPSSYA